MTAPQAKAWRDGKVISIPASGIIIGNILALEAGDLIATDARLLEAASLRCIEATLTGELLVQTKHSKTLEQIDVPLADRDNMMFMGASVAAGTVYTDVLATAIQTELGRIAGLIAATGEEEQTPLEKTRVFRASAGLGVAEHCCAAVRIRIAAQHGSVRVIHDFGESSGGRGAGEIDADWALSNLCFQFLGFTLGSFFISSLAVFLSLTLCYHLAPRRPTRFAEVWIAALCATAMLYAAEHLFVVYLKGFATLNAVYGAFGGIMALLLWIYLFGCIFIFGSCLCAAQAEERSTEKTHLARLTQDNKP